MEPPRAKPRVTHVRTGCLTCKRRRVKCPEERPSCSRCLRAGFVCAGYAVPKTWLFESSAESHARTIPAEAYAQPPDLPSRPLGDDEVYPTPASSPGYLILAPSGPQLLAPLQAGNSDPFDAYAISIGPRESYLIHFYRNDIIPQLYLLDHRSWLGILAADDWNHCLNCLKDEAAAYGLLARNSALESVVHASPAVSASPTTLDYMTSAQAALRKKLPLVDGSETPATVYPIMWATCLLAGTEMIMRSPTTEVHIRALGSLIVRYVELMGEDLDKSSILNLLFADITRATMTPARPVLDVVDWFPRLFQDVWQAAQQRLSHQTGNVSTQVHPDVKDVILRQHILNTRKGVQMFYNLFDTTLAPGDAKLLVSAAQSRRLCRQGQLLNIAMDTIEYLERPGLSLGEVQEHSARAYVALASLLWAQGIVPIMLSGTLLFDMAPGVLPHLKATISRSLATNFPQGPGSEGDNYKEARLWALYVGTQAELHRKEKLNLNKVCDEWFLESFVMQASYMRVETWQRAVVIFEQFLHSDHMMPHISQWW